MAEERHSLKEAPYKGFGLFTYSKIGFPKMLDNAEFCLKKQI